ncbi:MAG: winged helix-turn-helix transcriptional regulator [Candidatus Thorarchaeota archaeon]|nr:winged helix-turn-helix transcriptional regulator [Candidatus Thorarchaeota archaeon]MCK5240448.1 winged helix-turn-helix transcriptional regulator [Candidatus Thorarchaeota archaeon]
MGPEDQERTADINEPQSLEALAKILTILGNETRLKVIAALQDGKMFIQELSQSLGVSYPLLHLHLKNLESNGIVKSEYSVGTDKTRRYVKRYFELVDFRIEVSPELVANIANKELKDKKRKK